MVECVFLSRGLFLFFIRWSRLWILFMVLCVLLVIVVEFFFSFELVFMSLRVFECMIIEVNVVVIELCKVVISVCWYFWLCCLVVCWC